ncbi:MAG: hypothetical protein ACRC3B_11650 [Bacteroidia bacterium]
MNNAVTHVNTKFEVRLDSIERRLTVNKWETDSSYYLHYTVTNISMDTLTYVTNSCFYYNHYSLKVGQAEFDINPSGGCQFNEITTYLLAPGESFTKSEWITATNLNALTKGEWSVTLSIPLVKDNEKTYRVDGRVFVENQEYIVFDRRTKITETYLNNRKPKQYLTGVLQKGTYLFK